MPPNEAASNPGSHAPPVVEESIDWDGLMVCLQDSNLVPVVGQQILEGSPAAELPLLLARRLPKPFGEILDGTAQDIHAVASRALQRNPATAVRTALAAELSKLAVPDALTRLAQIQDITLFVTTSIDGLLERALTAARGKVLPLSWNPQSTRAVDLPAAELPATPALFPLFGRASTKPDFALSEDDVLDWVGAFQALTNRPPNLASVLGTSNLLFLGCGYSDWLTRFLLRALCAGSFSQRSSRLELLIQATADPNLVVFLTRNQIQLHHGRNAVGFVNELHDRWVKRRRILQENAARSVPPAPRPEDHWVFLSYASEDRARVDTLAEKLEAGGVTVWKDDRRLRPGDAWDLQIREAIQSCALFIPCISQTTASSTESYFFKEWRWARDRATGIAPGEAFIFPVALDDVPPGARGTGEFADVQWTKLGGLDEDQKIAQLARRLDETIKNRVLTQGGYQ
jgi:hypothetical protein